MRGIAVVVSLALGLQAQPAPSTPQTGAIAGLVVDASTGKPMSGVIVSISAGALPVRAASGESLRVLTGSDGRFLFEDLGPGNFSVIASKIGYGPGASPRLGPLGTVVVPVPLTSNQRKTDVVVRMSKNGAVGGTVTDEMGEPLVGVQLRALRRTITGGRRRFSPAGFTAFPTVMTDDRGMYRFADMLPGEYLIVASTPQVAVAMPMMRDSPSGVRNLFELGGPISMPGTPGSIQIGNAAYRLGRGAPTPPPPSGGRLAVYPPTFYPSASNAAQATTITITSGEERTGIDLQLQPVPTGRISGTLTGPDGPASMVTVRLVPAGSEDVLLGDDIPAGVTDRSGAFIFPAVPAGQYTLRAGLRPSTAPGAIVPETGLFTDLPIAATGSHIDGVVAILRPGLRLGGRLEFEGIAERPSPARMRRVSLLIEPFELEFSKMSFPIPDGSGQFTSIGLPPGKYFMRVAGSPDGWMFKSATLDGQDITDLPIELRADDVTGIVLTFTDRWSGLGGVVRNARNAPDPGATVLAFPTDVQSWSNFGANPRRLREARTNARGEFGMTSLPPGDYYAVAVPQEQAADWREPRALETLSRIATRITITEGEHRKQDLTTREVKQ
jgi:hypothetical protein